MMDFSNRTEVEVMKIVRVNTPERKRSIAREVLSDLPEWFGIPEAVEEYVCGSAEKTMFAAETEDGACIGFMSLHRTSAHTAELYVLGVKSVYHGQGAGRAMFEACLREARSCGCRLMQVKTLAAGCCEEYDATRRFYERLGFLHLEVFPTLWDEGNPCLIMVMPI